MTTTIVSRLKEYRKALMLWLDRDGLDGCGGSWNRSQRKYDNAQEPLPEINDGDTEFERKMFSDLRKMIVREAMERQAK